jgi:hypothetical protein
MDAVSTKPKHSKSMRVATVFTGVAAATVGMTQVANAQDVTHAAHNPVSKHIARRMRPATARTFFGSIQSFEACGVSEPSRPATDFTWLHLYWWDASHDTSSSACYGFKGQIISPPGFGVTYECGGNNYGSLDGYNADGKLWYFDYHPGTTYAHLNKGSLWQVAIWSWSGHDKCGRL